MLSLSLLSETSPSGGKKTIFNIVYTFIVKKKLNDALSNVIIVV